MSFFPTYQESRHLRRWLWRHRGEVVVGAACLATAAAVASALLLGGEKDHPVADADAADAGPDAAADDCCGAQRGSAPEAATAKGALASDSSSDSDPGAICEHAARLPRASDASKEAQLDLSTTLGLSPAFVAMQTGQPSSQGLQAFTSDLSLAASAAPYAPSADSPAAASRYPTGPVLREPSALSIGLAAGDHRPHDKESCRAANASNRAHSGGGNLSSPQWGWYESFSPQLGPPGTRAIASAQAALGTAPRQFTPAVSAPLAARSPVPPAADPAAATAKSPPRPSDGLDMYVSGMGGLPLPGAGPN
ncbi:hypothetical protein FNF31_01376 [Cafeteria roenbergensis]|uniref:Uncharacterized protein n=1 Tax=Cafeteria roenbergensis TaxID=33653 RepID=A0A5A8DMZ7_CAFRO|nr:hypothetical protein FNF31_01376 [Cafeteria roenbergensis]